jgi:hypothetical protein
MLKELLDAMADQRAKVGQEIVLACRDVLAQYDDDNTIRCQSSHKECDYIIYAALHRGFRSKSLFPADEDPHAHLMLNNIVQNVSGVVDSVTLSLQSIESLSSQNYGDDSDHYYYCRSIIDGVMQNLQAKPEQIKPLDLTAFSEELTSFPLEPSAPDSWVTWNALLRTGNFSTSSSLRPVRLEICKFGDIEITLKTATIHAAYLVSSHQLRTNSPVFRDLLGPDSEFGAYTRNCQVHSGLTVNTAERYRLEVKKDLDPAAFAAVLYIFHAGGKHLSGSIPFAGLVKVAVVCDYYNCSAALGPWYGKWVDHWKTYIVDRGYEDWLLIAWVFGEYQIFQTLTKNLSERGIMENNEFLIVSSEEPRVVERLSEHIPPVIIGMCARLKIVLSNYIDGYGLMDRFNDSTTKQGL